MTKDSANLLSRGATALLLGYATAGLWQAALARTLPMARIDATTTATMASFAVFAGAVVCSFAMRSAMRAALGLVTACLLAGFLLLANH